MAGKFSLGQVFYQCCKHEWMEKIWDLLLSEETVKGIDQNLRSSDGMRALDMACADNRVNVIKMLLELKNQGRTPLRLDDMTATSPPVLLRAILKHHWNLVPLLILAGSSCNVVYGSQPIFHYMLDSGEDAVDDETYIHIIELMIEYGADVCKMDNVGSTALHHAGQRRGIAIPHIIRGYVNKKTLLDKLFKTYWVVARQQKRWSSSL